MVDRNVRKNATRALPFAMQFHVNYTFDGSRIFVDYLATWKSDYVLHNEVDDIFQRVLCILSVFLLVKKVAMFTFPFEDWYWDVCSMLEQLLGFFDFFWGTKLWVHENQDHNITHSANQQGVASLRS